jgi:O-antigen biosynthesis protein WbqP
MGFWFDCRCFFGTFLSVLRSDGVVEGGTGELNRQKEEVKK